MSKRDPEHGELYFVGIAHGDQMVDIIDHHLLEVAQETDGIEPRASLFVQAERREVEDE